MTGAKTALCAHFFPGAQPFADHAMTPHVPAGLSIGFGLAERHRIGACLAAMGQALSRGFRRERARRTPHASVMRQLCGQPRPQRGAARDQKVIFLGYSLLLAQPLCRRLSVLCVPFSETPPSSSSHGSFISKTRGSAAKAHGAVVGQLIESSVTPPDKQ